MSFFIELGFGRVSIFLDFDCNYKSNGSLPFFQNPSVDFILPFFVDAKLLITVMYKERWKIERTNAWIDGFKNVLVRFDTTVSSWKGWNFLAFIVIFLKKIITVR